MRGFFLFFLKKSFVIKKILLSLTCNFKIKTMKNSECLDTLINRNFSINGDVECREINVTLDITNDDDERLMEVFCTVNLIGEPKVVERSFILNPDTNPTIVENFENVFLNDEHLIKVCDNKAIDLALSSLEESILFSQQSKFLWLKHNS